MEKIKEFKGTRGYTNQQLLHNDNIFPVNVRHTHACAPRKSSEKCARAQNKQNFSETNLRAER